ncbi:MULTISPECIES: HmuY family protein [Myroides]|uniref:HmuY protein n=1 Tax=Myroides albus TaxID=2562892 RepID=A0A6I3LHU8_9FLAO|nr:MULTISPECIES: HmuY family protein [Myroides]MTG97374.1 hypothetical protein [Myroides albus]MVX34341.1 hypothetical protein [Myroides sp. LoEW2-1]UVD80540.1 HmuY family protein [Myroides albus]
MESVFKHILSLIIISTLFVSCEKDSSNGNSESREFIVAFQEQSIIYENIKEDREIVMNFSDVAEEDGTVEIVFHEINATYGIDYRLYPEANNNRLVVPFKKGTRTVSFQFKNLIYPFDRRDKTIQFHIDKVNYSIKEPSIKGYSSMVITFDAALGGVISPNLGGPNEENQVYVDLGGIATYEVKRDSWDLAFFSGNEHVVKLNSSIYMAAGEFDSVNLDQVTEGQLESLKQSVQIGTFDATNVKYIDFPDGDLNKTAISKVKNEDNENKVFLLNLGFKPGINDGVSVGSVNVSGESRGWMKVRILKRDNGYLLQYARLNEKTHQEVLITKNNAYNFQFFSFDSESLVAVEPSKGKWDLNFTVFTNTVDQQGTPKGSYGFSDFILHNRYGGVLAYRVKMPLHNKDYYKSFSKEDVEENLFSDDLRTIGSTWRDVANDKILYKDVFYVVRDSKGNFYKFKMLSLRDEKGNRGFPKFEYRLLE